MKSANKFKYIYSYKNNSRIGHVQYRNDTELKTIFIEAIWVDPAYRELGVGNEMMQKMKIICDQSRAKMMILWVDRGFKAFSLNKWYKRHGFKSIKPFKKTRAMVYHGK